MWRISEGPDEEDKPQITGKAVVAVQFIGEEGAAHPRVCWHCHKQVINSFLNHLLCKSLQLIIIFLSLVARLSCEVA